MDNNMMQMMMQMMAQQNQMMTMIMQQMMTQPQPNPVQAQAQMPNQQEIIAQSNAAASTSVQEIADLRAEIEQLKSQLAETQSKLTAAESSVEQLRTQLSQSKSSKITEPLSQSKVQAEPKVNTEESRQMTLEDEIQYQSRHGQEGHENYTRIMDQLSEEDREKVRDMYYADSDGVFSLDDLAQKKGTTFEDIFYTLHPEMKEKTGPQMVEFTNEFGF